MWILPSYTVTFMCPTTAGAQKIEWQVNTEEALDAFCKILRLNGIDDYTVTRREFGQPKVEQVAS